MNTTNNSTTNRYKFAREIELSLKKVGFKKSGSATVDRFLNQPIQVGDFVRTNTFQFGKVTAIKDNIATIPKQGKFPIDQLTVHQGFNK